MLLLVEMLNEKVDKCVWCISLHATEGWQEQHFNRGVIGDVITLFTLTSLKLTLFTLFFILKTLRQCRSQRLLGPELNKVGSNVYEALIAGRGYHRSILGNIDTESSGQSCPECSSRH